MELKLQIKKINQLKRQAILMKLQLKTQITGEEKINICLSVEASETPVQETDNKSAEKTNKSVEASETPVEETDNKSAENTSKSGEASTDEV